MENFIKTWFFDKREKIEKNLYSESLLQKDIDDLAEFILKNQLIDKISAGEFSRHFHLKRNDLKIGDVLFEGTKEEIPTKKKIIVQSMAANPLNKIDELCDEFKALADAGSEIIRIAVLGISDAENMEKLAKKLENSKYAKVPIVMCGQYNIFPIISQTNILNYISKLRINPGNISIHKNNSDNFSQTIKYLTYYNKNLLAPGREKIAVRIGVNWGSLDEKLKMRVMDLGSKLNSSTAKNSPQHLEITTLALSAILSGLYAELLGLEKNLIVVSCKTSEPESAYLASKLLSIFCDYQIHLGITEAGSGEDGVILSACGLAPMLREGIGATIRVSITPKIDQSRTAEILVAKNILASLGITSWKPKVISCPGCGRTDSSYFRILTEETKKYIDKNLDIWFEKYKNEEIKALKIAVMGCLVNGPGEMGHADIGISLPGFREKNAVLIYLDGKKFKVLKGENIREEFFEIIDCYIEKRFAFKNFDELNIALDEYLKI